MAGRVSNKFMALSSIALGAIYVAGFVVTEPSSSAQVTPPTNAIANHSPVAPAPSHTHTSQHTSSGTSSNKSKPTSSNSTSSQASKQTTSKHTSGQTAKQAPVKQPVVNHQMYLDGTYRASGSNRIGTVAVAVTIKNGKIQSAQITQCDTHYPESYIDPVLPQQVVSNQTYRVSAISGATLSSEDFAYAVYQALSQAKNPHYQA